MFSECAFFFACSYSSVRLHSGCRGIFKLCQLADIPFFLGLCMSSLFVISVLCLSWFSLWYRINKFGLAFHRCLYRPPKKWARMSVCSSYVVLSMLSEHFVYAAVYWKFILMVCRHLRPSFLWVIDTHWTVVEEFTIFYMRIHKSTTSLLSVSLLWMLSNRSFPPSVIVCAPKWAFVFCFAVFVVCLLSICSCSLCVLFIHCVLCASLRCCVCVCVYVCEFFLLQILLINVRLCMEKDKRLCGKPQNIIYTKWNVILIWGRHA